MQPLLDDEDDAPVVVEEPTLDLGAAGVDSPEAASAEEDEEADATEPDDRT